MGNRIHVVKLEARRLDSSTSPLLRQVMTDAWDKGFTIVALDLSNVVYIDSLGISSLISEQRRRPQGKRIVLCALGDYVRDVLEVTQLVRVFDIYPSVEAVQAQFGSA